MSPHDFPDYCLEHFQARAQVFRSCTATSLNLQDGSWESGVCQGGWSSWSRIWQRRELLREGALEIYRGSPQTQLSSDQCMCMRKEPLKGLDKNVSELTRNRSYFPKPEWKASYLRNQKEYSQEFYLNGGGKSLYSTVLVLPNQA